jgi:ABC-2 type transport system ATP-binding protein
MGSYSNNRTKQTEDQTHAYFERLGLAFAQHSYVQTYSAGMKKRLGIILSLIHNPDLLVWDEPMS